MYIQNFVVEVTRRCNMVCSHCLRGKAQNLEMSRETVSRLFRGIDSIRALTITGGEPSLAVERIEWIIDELKNNHVELGYFYIATNGKKVSQEFLIALIKLYALSDEKDMCQVLVSTSYHDLPVNNDQLELLSALNFVEIQKDAPFALIEQGFAENLSGNKRELSLEWFEVDEDSIMDGYIYINAKGDFIPSCDMSYDNQDLVAKFGNVNDDGFNYFEAIEQFNEIQEYSPINEDSEYGICFSELIDRLMEKYKNIWSFKCSSAA